MSKSMDGCSALRRTGRSALLAACGLGFGMTLAFAQQVQEVPMKHQKTGDKQICLVKHEALERKTGAVLIAARISSTSSSTYRPPIRW